MSKKTLVTIKTRDDLEKLIAFCRNSSDPISVLTDVYKNIEKYMDEHNPEDVYNPGHPFYKALTLSEFDNGHILSEIVPERYKTLAIELSRKLQYEYKCNTSSEKATAELVALNYVRILDLQEKIRLYDSSEYLLNYQRKLDEMTEADRLFGKKMKLRRIDFKYQVLLSKELDYAQRHYIATLQLLRMIKQPPLRVNINSGTTVIGRNQVVQTTNK